MKPSHPVRRQLLRGFAFLVASVLGLLLLAVMAGPQLGYHYAVVKSGSMEPTYHVGSVIVTQKVDAANVKVGDVISWQVPEDSSKIITHRVIERVGTGQEVAFRTQGDANNIADGTLISASSLRGRVMFSVPKVGEVVPLLRTKAVFLAFILIPAAILIAGELQNIWRDLRGPAGTANNTVDGVFRDYEGAPRA
jgi:signal peptidase